MYLKTLNQISSFSVQRSNSTFIVTKERILLLKYPILYVYIYSALGTTHIILVMCTIQMTHLLVYFIRYTHGGFVDSSFLLTECFYSNWFCGISALLPWWRVPADDVAASDTPGLHLTCAGMLAACSTDKISHELFRMWQHYHEPSEWGIRWQAVSNWVLWCHRSFGVLRCGF